MRLLSSFKLFIIRLTSLWGLYGVSEYVSFFSNLHISAKICKNSADLHISANICKNPADLHRFAKIQNLGSSLPLKLSKNFPFNVLQHCKTCRCLFHTKCMFVHSTSLIHDAQLDAAISLPVLEVDSPLTG